MEIKRLEGLGEKAMAPHSSTLAWKIPWTEEPGGLQSMGSLRIGHDWATSLSLFTFMHWRRKWQPTPVFLPGESQGRGNLVGCCLWGCTEQHRKFLYEKVERPSIHSLSSPFNNYYFFPAEFVCICICVWFCIRLLGRIAEPNLWALWVSVSV